MTEYFLGLIVFAFVGAVIFSLAPQGASKGYVRLLCGLCSVGCIAFPVFELIADGGENFFEISELFETKEITSENSVEIYNDALNFATVKNAEASLKSDIIKELSAKYEDVDVKIELNDNSDEIYIKRIVVYIYPSGYASDPKKIKKLCQNKLGMSCDIVYK